MQVNGAAGTAPELAVLCRSAAANRPSTDSIVGDISLDWMMARPRSVIGIG
jgi:hypothetical protein